MNKYSNEQIAKMKAKLLRTEVTLVLGIYELKEDAIPEITIHEGISKEQAARLSFDKDGYIVMGVIAEDDTQEEVEAAVERVKQLVYTTLEDAGL